MDKLHHKNLQYLPRRRYLSVHPPYKADNSYNFSDEDKLKLLRFSRPVTFRGETLEVELGMDDDPREVWYELRRYTGLWESNDADDFVTYHRQVLIPVEFTTYISDEAIENGDLEGFGDLQLEDIWAQLEQSERGVE